MNITFASITEPDFPALRELAGGIWRRHYTTIISSAQIEYMLAGRLSDEVLRGYLDAADKWLDMAWVGDRLTGYCAYELSSENRADLKLGQLYLLESHRGQGVGRALLAHVEGRGRDRGCGGIFLQVNKKNTEAIGFYRAMGFTVRCEAVFDIGNGYVMDDYVLEKQLPSGETPMRGTV